MSWSSKQLLLKREHFPSWGKSKAMLPTPFQLSENITRTYITFCDENEIGRVGYFDVNTNQPTKIINISAKPVLDIGKPGHFDDNGVVACSVIKVKSQLFMYYAGFEKCSRIRYRIFTGLAISNDGGESFTRISTTPVLERSPNESLFRCGPYVLFDKGVYRMWYIAGSEWFTTEDKKLPIYDLHYIESTDGVHWPQEGKKVMSFDSESEHGLGRPYIIKKYDSKREYHLFYSIRKTATLTYNLGYATSTDGLNWLRDDRKVYIAKPTDTFDSEAAMFLVPLTDKLNGYYLYNGNNFGTDGVAIIKYDT